MNWQNCGKGAGMYRILIVEDDEIIARSLKKHLESWDYDVVCVEDFSDVMKKFAGAAPQLVLMDIGKILHADHIIIPAFQMLF
jgi:CheY-like chemotaxis protein